MKQFLLIGGAGFIGSELQKVIDPRTITVYDKFTSISHSTNTLRQSANSGAEVVVGDVCNRDDVESFVRTSPAPEGLLYLAAETGTGRSLYNCHLNANVNVAGLANVLDMLAKYEKFPKRIVLTSTRAVYGEGPYRNKDTSEIYYPAPRSRAQLDAGTFEFPNSAPIAANASQHTPRPVNVYGSTKLAQEHLLLNWAQSFGIPLYIFRLQNVYGAGQSLSNPYTGVLIHFIRQLKAGNSIHIFEKGGITRDFVHVSDVARLLKLGLLGDGTPGIYDCGSATRVALEDVAEILRKIVDGPPIICTTEYRLGDVRHATADITETLRHFNWQPEISLTSGLEDLFSWAYSQL